jgi:hypothetical protein
MDENQRRPVALLDVVKLKPVRGRETAKWQAF